MVQQTILYMQRSARMQADVVFLPIYYQPASQILAEAKEAGL